MRTRRNRLQRRKSRRGGRPPVLIENQVEKMRMRKIKRDDILTLPRDMLTRDYQAITDGCQYVGNPLKFDEVLKQLKTRADRFDISDINGPICTELQMLPIDFLVKINDEYYVPGFEVHEDKIIFEFGKDYTDLDSFLVAIGAIDPPLPNTLPPAATLQNPLPPAATLQNPRPPALPQALSQDDIRLITRLGNQDRSGRMGRSLSVPRHDPDTPGFTRPEPPRSQGPPSTGGPALRPPAPRPEKQKERQYVDPSGNAGTDMLGQPTGAAGTDV
jgi:hypothetical protein